MSKQYTISLTPKHSYSIHDFIFSSCNETLANLLDGLESWGTQQYPGIVLIYGPEKSGKTHFAYLVAEKFGGIILPPDTNIELLELYHNQLFILEDIDRIWEEESLFHIFNYLVQNRKSILITSRDNKEFSLPDLSSRIGSLDVRIIKDPDDNMVSCLLRKYISCRSINVSEEVMIFIINRIERKFSTIFSVVDVIDRLSLEQKRNITVPFLNSLKLFWCEE
ncbi:MAG: DnaA ue Had protein [Pseudomonadota bacterium]|jgi:chromosomal replication initiation ATPase DnaA